MESKTPICDHSKYETDHGAEVVPLYIAMGLEFKLHEMELEIGNSNAKWLRLETELAEARAEIERLKELLSLNEQLRAHCRFVTYPSKKLVEKLKRLETALEAKGGRMNECCFCENHANLGICSQCQEAEHQAFVALKQELADARAEIERLKDSICYANKTNQSCDFPKLQEQQKLIEQMRNAIKGALRSADAEWESKNQGHDWAEACKTMRTALEAAKGASDCSNDHINYRNVQKLQKTHK